MVQEAKLCSKTRVVGQLIEGRHNSGHVLACLGTVIMSCTFVASLGGSVTVSWCRCYTMTYCQDARANVACWWHQMCT